MHRPVRTFAPLALTSVADALVQILDVDEDVGFGDTMLPVDVGLVDVCEQGYRAGGTDPTAYETAGTHAFVQSIYGHARQGMAAPSRRVIGRLEVLVDVSVFGTITDPIPLGGSADRLIVDHRSSLPAGFAFGLELDDEGAHAESCRRIHRHGAQLGRDVDLHGPLDRRHSTDRHVRDRRRRRCRGARRPRGAGADTPSRSRARFDRLPLGCASPVGRHETQAMSSRPLGSFVVQTGLAPLPGPMGTSAVQPGETWYFQSWHRQSPNTSNFTDAISVLFQ